MNTTHTFLPESVLPARGRRLRPLICSASIAFFAAGLFALSGSAQAASTTWKAAPTDPNWATAANWASGAAPGLATGLTTNDVATFNTALSGGIGGIGNPIVLDATRSIGGITFDTANVGAYVIGANAGNALILSNIGNGPGTHVIQMTSAVTNSQVIAAPIKFVAPSSTNGIFGFVNNASASAATLTLSGAITNTVARPAILLLDGTNTGTNTISGVITETGSTQGTPVLVKKGTGTWIISGANAFTGTAMTSTASSNGIQVLDGVLSLQNNQALGTSGTANQLQVWIGNKSTTYVYNGALTTTQSSTSGGGTLEITNGITLDNGLSLNLWNGGTIRGVGAAATNGRINLDTTAATSATISTVNSSDVFTIGNGANDFTGGAADTVTHIAGPGTVVIATASTNYLGTISIDAGALKNGSSTNGLGSAGVVAFGSGSTGKLQLGNNLGLTRLTTNAGTPTAGIVETGVAGTQTLTLTAATSSIFGGTLQNGTGTLALTKAGVGTLTLSGNSNTYSGNTAVNGGVLNVTNTSGSATGTSAVALNTATLTGAGIITGTVTAASTGVITPGTVTAGSAGSGVLTLGNLTMTGGTTINYGLTGTATNNYISTGTLTLPGSGTVVLNLYTPGTNTAFAAAGTYDLFQYTTLAGGAMGSAFSFGTSIAGFSATFGTAPAGGGNSYLTLTLAAAGVIGSWTNNGGVGTGNWNDPLNWSGGIPSNAGDSAVFTSAPGTITLDANKTVGGLTFNNASGYAIVIGNTLTLDNNGAGVAIGVNTGAHDIQSALGFNDNVTVTPAAGTQMTLSGNITQTGGPRSLTKMGTGTMVLSGTNSYSGGTFVSNGVLTFNALIALGAGTTLDLGGASTNGTLKYAGVNTADISSLTVTINGGGGTIDTNGNNVTLANAIGNNGAGGLTKAGNGILTLSGANTYAGNTTISGGTVSAGGNAGLGLPGAGGQLIFTGGGSTLATTASFGLFNGAAGINDRPVALNGTDGTLAPVSGTTLTVSGAITGIGKLIKADAGQVTILNATFGQNTYSAGTLISAGAVFLGDGNSNTSGLGAGTVTLDGGTLNLRYTNNTATQNGNFANNLVVDGGFTGTLITTARGDVSGSLTGSGTLNVQTDYVRSQFDGNWSAFTGQINVTPNTSGGDFRINNFNGFGTARINLANGVTMYMQANFGAGGLTNSIGELTGGAASYLRGGPTGGRVMTWSVGSAGTASQFDGNIQDGNGPTAITKVGAAAWTLTGVNTYTGGTTVSNGALALNGANTGTGVIRGTVTVSAGATLQLASTNALGYTAGVEVTAVNINGGTLDDIATLDQGFNQTYNLTGGTMQSNGGVSNPAAGQYYALGTGSAVNSLASATTSAVAGRLNLRSDNGNTNVTFTVADGVAATDLLVSAAITESFPAVGITKAGAGVMQLTGANSYTGATMVNEGTLILNGANTGDGVIRGVVTVASGATLQLASANALGYTAGAKVDTVNINGGLLDDVVNGDQGFNQTYNLTGGTMRSNGGTSNATASQWYAFGPGTAVNSLASAATSTITGRIILRSDSGNTNTTFTVADGAAPTDLLVSAAITKSELQPQAVGITKAGAGLMQLTGGNTYIGVTNIAQGTLSAAGIVVVGGASNLGNATSAVVLGDATNRGTLSYTGNSVSYTRGFTVNAGGGEIDTTTGGQTLTIATGAITSTTDTSLTIGGAGSTTITAAVGLGATTGLLTKTGAGILNINSGAQTYATLTTTAGAGVTNVSTALGTGTTTVNANSTMNFYASQTLAALNIADGVEVSFGTGLPFAGGGEKFGGPALVPEPGSAGLLLVGALGVLGRRRRS